MALELRNRWRNKSDVWWDWEAFLDDLGTGDLGNVGVSGLCSPSNFCQADTRSHGSHRGIRHAGSRPSPEWKAAARES
jgi:hypothetical protein